MPGVFLLLTFISYNYSYSKVFEHVLLHVGDFNILCLDVNI